MLLVMSTAGVFDAPPDESDSSSHSQLWTETWNRIHQFLPGLHDELFAPTPTARPSSPAPPPTRSIRVAQDTQLKEGTPDTSATGVEKVILQ